MNHTYLGLSVVLFCAFVANFIWSKLLLLTVFCVILLIYFKDDFKIFRYVATRVASFYLWICKTFNNILNMYNTNNTNFPNRKCLDNNGTIRSPSKINSVYHRLTPNVALNLNPPRLFETVSYSSNSGWNSNSSTSTNFFPKRLQSARQDTIRLSPSSKYITEENRGFRPSLISTQSTSPLDVSIKHMRLTGSESSTTTINKDYMDMSSRLNSPTLDAKLYANVNSPGFCSRVAERLSESVTHQPKYDSVGAFPVVNLKSQSPKIKIKTPVRVRLAPPSNDTLFSSTGSNSLNRSHLVSPDESMKSVLQVLKDISRKRIHSHVDEDIEDNSKRLRVSESQFDSESGLQTSLLQQGKRAREESSPIEDDVKKKRKPLQNNEILSSLSSSISIKPPHLMTKKRKAQAIDDSVNTTPVLGKLLKIQTELTPPPSILVPTPPEPSTTLPTSQELRSKSETPPSKCSVVEESEKEEEVVTVEADSDDGAVSRLLGRMSGQVYHSTQQPLSYKNNVFMSTNDLSLSPPKENRLAAMIAVLGGPSDTIQQDNVQIENGKLLEKKIKGKALFTSPETPDVSKQSKKVTFSESLTTTKLYDVDQTHTENSSSMSGTSVVTHATSLSSMTDGVLSNPTSIDQKLHFGSQNFNISKTASSEIKEPVTQSKSPTYLVSSANTLPKASNTMDRTVMIPSQITPIKGLESQSSTPTSMSNSSGLSNSGSSKPVFSFVSSNTLVESVKPNKPESPSNSDSVANKPFTFGSKSDVTPVVSTNIGFTSLPENSSVQNVISKSDMSSTADTSVQNKLTFTFGNKDTGVSSTFGKNEVEGKELVNGLSNSNTTTNSASPFVVSQGITSKQLFSPPSTSSLTAQAPTFSFGSSSPFTSNSKTGDTIIKSTASPIQLSVNQPAQPVITFSTSLSNPPQTTKQSLFSSNSQTSQNGDAFQISSSVASTQVPTQGSIFGNAITEAAGFGAVAKSKSGGELKSTTVQQSVRIDQSKNLFGNLPSNMNSKPSTFTAEASTPSEPSSQMWLPVSSPASSSLFGVPVSSSASQPNVVFGNPSTTTETTVFGTVTSNTVSVNNSFLNPSKTAGGQPSMFNNPGGNQLSKPMFVNSSNASPSFGILNNTANPPFGNQNNTNTPRFGNQNNSVITFGNQNNSIVPGFGNNKNSSNTSQGGFGTNGTLATSDTFSLSTSISSTTESKTSPFVFGSSTASKETVKQFGAASPFSFSSNAQPSATMSSSTQPAQPTFGAPGAAFGTSQQLPAFGSNMAQSQAAAPGFSFSQAPAAPAFQFSATGPQPAGGMFSIGSGSSTSRSKTANFRRRQKPT